MAASTFREHDGAPDASSEMIAGMCPGRLRCVRWPRITYCASESIWISNCACAYRGHGYNTRSGRQLHVLLRTWLSAVRNSMEWWKLAIGGGAPPQSRARLLDHGPIGPEKAGEWPDWERVNRSAVSALSVRRCHWECGWETAGRYETLSNR